MRQTSKYNTTMAFWDVGTRGQSALQKAPVEGAMSNSEIQPQNDSEASSRNHQETLRSGHVEVEG